MKNLKFVLLGIGNKEIQVLVKLHYFKSIFLIKKSNSNLLLLVNFIRKLLLLLERNFECKFGILLGKKSLIL